MGFENRDYTRDGSYTSGGKGDFMAGAPMCKKILIVTIAVFIAQIFFTRPATVADFAPQIEQIQADQELYGEEVLDDADGDPVARSQESFDVERYIGVMPAISVVQEWLKLDTDKVIGSGQVWRLITNAFCHDRFSIWHIGFNMLLLFWFGQFVEATYGSKEFLCFYLGSAVVASLAFIGLELFTGERHGGIGASGAVMAVICVFAMWNPHHTIRVYFLFPIQIRYLLLFYVIYDLHPVLLALSGTVMNTGIGHAAHLGGLLFGYLYYRNDWRLLPYWNGVAQLAGSVGTNARIRKSNLRVYSENDDYEIDREPEARNQHAERTRADLRFDEQLDDVLKKISESGQDSLTPREKRVLLQGSQRYRNR